MKKLRDDELEIELEEDVDLETATREALEAVARVEDQVPATTPPDSESAGREPAAPGDSSPAGSAADSSAAAEALAWREQALRARADYENLMRRTEKERDEAKRYLIASTFRDLLPIVDNLGRALAATGSADDLKLGVGLIHRQLLDLLRQYGVRAVEAVGRPFDPAFHEAVARHEDPSVSTPTVSEELQPGFIIGERLLRPALVKVAMPLPGRSTDPKPTEAAPPADTESGSGG